MKEVLANHDRQTHNRRSRHVSLCFLVFCAAQLRKDIQEQLAKSSLELLLKLPNLHLRKLGPEKNYTVIPLKNGGLDDESLSEIEMVPFFRGNVDFLRGRKENTR